ncbi:MAG: polyphosphate:AMP phosphotransferase [Woeseiaceae bacterium]|nr:polyphosphate:AMP phosphotransferase [Woeseiaceae bacterium]
MFETAELGQSVVNGDFKKRELQLRAELLTLQYRLHDSAKFPVIIDFAGVDGAGKGTTINMLNKWMDPRHLRTTGYVAPTSSETGRPRFWRYWRDMPPKGGIGLFLTGRYSKPLMDFVYGRIDELEFDEELSKIIRFETALVEDGALILKFWMHLSSEHQKERLEALSADADNAYRVRDLDWRNRERYDDFIRAAERIITRTNKGRAPWTIVEGVDPNYRHLRVGEIIADQLARHLDRSHHAPPADFGVHTHVEEASHRHTPLPPTVFDKLDMSSTIRKSDYKKKLPAIQSHLGELGRKAYEKGQSTVLVFEGPDASGKGGAIRRTVWSLDARSYRVHQFAAPTEHERKFHYLWRFWNRLPEAGHVSVFDRSWYGRVLVERVEGFASEDEWRRAYNEINEFESQIVEHGIVLIKFWIHVSKEEQLRRFEKRRDSLYKHWKLTEEDWRNREEFETYEQMGNDIVQYTSTKEAPWILIEGDSKHHARLKVMQTVIDHLEPRVE